ncbi:MAG TPA: hypothetical protein VN731_10275 [Rhodanobacter sp.]|nr:hypothetical protein [Rhodanobacter sp.]
MNEQIKNGGPALNERELDDDYPVYFDYLYVADGKIVRSDVQGSVATLRRDLQSQGISAERITSCDIFGRRAAREAKS